MILFRPDFRKKDLPQNSMLLGMDSSVGDLFILVAYLIPGRNKALFINNF